MCKDGIPPKIALPSSYLRLAHEMDVGHQKLRNNCDFTWSIATLSHEKHAGRQKLRKNCDFIWSIVTLSHEMDVGRQKLRKNCDGRFRLCKSVCVKASMCISVFSNQCPRLVKKCYFTIPFEGLDHYPRVSKQKKVEFDRLVLSPPALPL